MRPSELLTALHTAEKLKDTTRHCYTSGGRHESVAEHSWRIALMAFFLRETQEAQIYKALDKLEAVISHNESDISTWEDHEYDLQLTYGEQNVAFSPYLTALRQAVRQESLDKIAREGDRRK